MIDKRVRRHYEVNDESARLWDTDRGTLARLRTWDIFDRFLPDSGHVADIGGGPGVHAVHLVERGYQVTLVDPVHQHVDKATRAGAGVGLSCHFGDARDLPLPDAIFDAALLMGPLYHLGDTEDRQRALQETLRVLRPGGRLVAEVITRHAWIIDAAPRGLLGSPGIYDTFELNLRTGWSNDPDRVGDGVFWGYFHHVGEVGAEVERAGFRLDRLVAVEGFASLLGNLNELLRNPAATAGDQADRVRAVDAGGQRSRHRGGDQVSHRRSSLSEVNPVRVPRRSVLAVMPA